MGSLVARFCFGVGLKSKTRYRCVPSSLRRTEDSAPESSPSGLPGSGEPHQMASTIDFALTREPHLLDVIDDEWAQDKLPDDGEPTGNDTGRLHRPPSCLLAANNASDFALSSCRHPAACQRTAAARGWRRGKQSQRAGKVARAGAAVGRLKRLASKPAACNRATKAAGLHLKRELHSCTEAAVRQQG